MCLTYHGYSILLATRFVNTIWFKVWYTSRMSDRKPHVYPELDAAVTISIYTKSPEKWLLVDRETGEVYEGSPTGWWNKLKGKLEDIATE